jgi:hypothetical protein
MFPGIITMKLAAAIFTARISTIVDDRPKIGKYP